MAIAQMLIQQLLELTARYDGKRLSRVQLLCDQLSQVNELALQQAFEALSAGGPLAGAELELRIEPTRARCRCCGRQVELDAIAHGCPSCRADQFEIIDDKPLM
ncbi:MAG: hydrogenase maturation nickel metallochaperone HypA, partial [Phycisphaerae bacterium]